MIGMFSIGKKTIAPYDTVSYIKQMKVTALIDDPLIKDVTRYAHGKNLTESLVIVLKEWVALKKIKRLNQSLQSRPLQFKKAYSAKIIRAINRKK